MSLQDIISIIQGTISGTLYVKVINGSLVTCTINKVPTLFSKEDIQIAAFGYIMRSGSGLPIVDTLVRMAQFVLLYGYGTYDYTVVSNSNGILQIWINEYIPEHVEVKTIWAGGGSLWKDSLYGYLYPRRDA